MAPNPRHPAPTWPDGSTPTVDQLREWLRAHVHGQHDARVAADMILGMLAQEKRLHLEARRSLHDASRALERYRLAWLSARRRRGGA